MGLIPPRLQIPPGMRHMLDYAKFGGVTRLLVLGAEHFFEKSWMRAARALGWECVIVPSVMVGALTRDQIQELFTTVCSFKPDFILSSNYTGMDQLGLFAHFFADARIPYVSWFTDTPRMILYERTVCPSHYQVAATWERAYIPYLKELGFEHVVHMPLATDPELFRGVPLLGEWTRPVAFVGTSMVERANEIWEKLEGRPDIVRVMLEAFEGGCVTRERFAKGVGAIIDPAFLASCSPYELRSVELGLVYEATRRQRAEMVMAMESFDLEVRGDVYWRYVAARSGGALGYFTDLAPYYRTTAVNLNDTSLQMRWTVNQRVFDCPAAGGFLLTDAQEDLEMFFEVNEEVVVYRGLDELRDKAAYYLVNPKARVCIVEKAQRRILAEHLYTNRLQALECYLRKQFA